MVRGLHAAVAVAAVCGLAAGGAAPAAAEPATTGWPRPPELASALGHRRGAVVAVRPADGKVIGVAGDLERVREAAPPGSIAKIVTAYAALAGGFTDAGRRIACTGTFGGRSCATAHGPLELEQALARSCNVHFLALGAEVGAARLAAAARRFGFGSLTGADARESAGTVSGSALDLAYGVGGFSATPLQLARAVAAVASGGRVVRLHLGGGPAEAEVVNRLEVRHLAPIRAGLRAATRGAGTGAALASLDVAGKTGTAVFEGRVAGEAPRWYGHFAGYAPGERPEVVVAVRVEGRSAAHDAVPVARSVLEWYQVAGAATRRPHPVAPRTVRVLQWAASDIRSIEILAPGSWIESGPERVGIGERRVVVRLAEASVTATTGGRTLGAARLVLRPAPGKMLSVRPLASARRGRAEHLPQRRIAGPLTLASGRGRLVAVADLPLDAYAAAVGTAELGPGWPAQAVAAQTVLARTYAARHVSRHAADGADVCDLTHCQVYKGELPADSPTRRAVAATAGTVLTSGGEPIEALYHSACGGRRLANEEVFGGKPLPYLRGGDDPWCARSPRSAAWQAVFTRDQLTRAFAADSSVNVGTVASLAIATRTPSGAPAAVSIAGTHGSRTIPAYQAWRDLGTALGWNHVKSVRFSILPAPAGDGAVFVGRGLGHAVGLCQWGARAQAERGYSATRILAYYYPGTTLSATTPSRTERLASR